MKKYKWLIFIFILSLFFSNHILNSISFFELGKKLLQSNDYKKAVYYLRQAMYEHPDNVFIYYKLGEAYTAEGNYNMAINIYQKVLDKYAISTGNDKNIALIHQTLAILSKKGKKYNTAIKYYKLREKDARKWLSENAERLQTTNDKSLIAEQNNNLKWIDTAKNEIKNLELARAAHIDAIVTFAKNDIQLKRFDKSVWIQLRPMVKVNEGDNLKSKKAGTAFIRIDNTSYIYIGPETNLIFDKLRSSSFKKYSVIDLNSGFVLVNTEQNLLNNYTINIGNVSFTSETSKFFVQYSQDEIKIAMFYGNGTITFNNNKSKIYKLNEAIIKDGKLTINNISTQSVDKFAILKTAIVSDQQIIVYLMKQLQQNLYTDERENIVSDLIRMGPEVTPYLVSRLKRETRSGHIPQTFALVESITNVLSHIGDATSKKALTNLKKYPDKYIDELADYGLKLIAANQ